MATLGYTTHGANHPTATNPTASKFTPTENGTITSMTAWVFTYAGGTSNLRFAIYSDNAGSPDSKLAESGSAVAINASDTEFSTAISYAFTSGVPIWLALWESDGNSFFGWDTGTTHQTSEDSGPVFPTWPATWTEDFALDRVYSIYATYTPSGGDLMGQILT